MGILSELGNNQTQDILEDMGMLDENGRCPYTAEDFNIMVANRSEPSKIIEV